MFDVIFSIVLIIIILLVWFGWTPKKRMVDLNAEILGIRNYLFGANASGGNWTRSIENHLTELDEAVKELKSKQSSHSKILDDVSTGLSNDAEHFQEFEKKLNEKLASVDFKLGEADGTANYLEFIADDILEIDYNESEAAFSHAISHLQDDVKENNKLVLNALDVTVHPETGAYQSGVLARIDSLKNVIADTDRVLKIAQNAIKALEEKAKISVVEEAPVEVKKVLKKRVVKK